MILISIGFFIMLYSLKNFKKAFFSFLIYQIYWFYLAEIISVSGLPTITIGMIMNAWFLVLFIIKREKYINTPVRMPYTTPMLLILFSSLVTCFTGLAGFKNEFTRAISLAIQLYPSIWIAWYLVETEEDFKYLFKRYTIIFLIAALFGIVEYVFKFNVLVEYKSMLREGGIATYSLANGRGYRVMSVFEHCIGGGMTLGLYAAFVFMLYVNTKGKMINKDIALVGAFLCIPCVLLTKMRSAMIFTLICLLGAVDFKKKRFYKLLYLALILLVCIAPLILQNSDLFLSLFSSSIQKKLGGSNISMRFNQLNAVLNLMKISPIGGLGEIFSEFVSNVYTMQALDYESLWFEQIVKHGMLGVIVHVIMIVYSVIVIPKKYKSKELFILSFAYWAIYTITSVPSFRLTFYYFILFYFIKHSKVYLDMKSGSTKKV